MKHYTSPFTGLISMVASAIVCYSNGAPALHMNIDTPQNSITGD